MTDHEAFIQSVETSLTAQKEARRLLRKMAEEIKTSLAAPEGFRVFIQMSGFSAEITVCDDQWFKTSVILRREGIEIRTKDEGVSVSSSKHSWDLRIIRRWVLSTRNKFPQWILAKAAK